MPKTHKSVQSKNLLRARTWQLDTDPTSRYFGLSQLPELLTSGKNAFLINGSPSLVTTTELLVEITDAEGKSVFLTPIENYNEGLSRVVSIEIYEDTPRGPATLTIMGEIHKSIDGQITPPEWQNKYNVKWQKNIFIDPALPNTTPIRLYEYPIMETAEILSIYRDVSQSIVSISQSVTMSGDSIQTNNTQIILGNGPSFYIESDRPVFIREMAYGVFTAFSSSGTPFVSVISQVINNRIVKLSDTFMISGSMSSFTTTDFSIQYSSSVVTVPSQLTRSIVDVNLTNLQAFSGQIKKVRLSVNNRESPSTFSSIGESELTPIEVLEASSSLQQGNAPIKIGFFTTKSVVDTYWTAGSIGSSYYY